MLAAVYVAGVFLEGVLRRRCASKRRIGCESIYYLQLPLIINKCYWCIVWPLQTKVNDLWLLCSNLNLRSDVVICQSDNPFGLRTKSNLFFQVTHCLRTNLCTERLETPCLWTTAHQDEDTRAQQLGSTASTKARRDEPAIASPHYLKPNPT